MIWNEDEKVILNKVIENDDGSYTVASGDDDDNTFHIEEKEPVVKSAWGKKW